MATRKPAARKSTSKRTSATTRKTAAKKATSQRAKAPRGPAKSTSRPAPAAVSVQPGQRLFVLSVPFSERGVANANGAMWDPARRATVYVGSHLPYGLTPYQSPDYSWERWIEDEANRSPLPCAPGVPMTLRPHQIEASDRIAAAAARGWRGFVEADDVGLGKTLASLHGAYRVAAARQARTMLIVCPKAVIPVWRRAIASLGDQGLRIVVINYDRVKNLLSVPPSAQDAKRTRTKNKRIATQGVPLVNWDIVIADESHKMANSTSQRSQAMARLARYAETASTAPFVIWVSATIGTDPTSLGYLTPLMSQLTSTPRSALRDYGQWLADNGYHVTHNERFDKWEMIKPSADATPTERAEIERLREADCRRVRDLLFGGPDRPAIRRLPTQIAGWPEIVRVEMPVEFSLDQRRLYEQAWGEFRRDMALAQRGRDHAAGHAARMRFRQKASLLRVDGTVDQVRDLIENGHQVAVSVLWLESLDAIAEALNGHGIRTAEISGRADDRKESERLRFQTGQAHVALFTVAEGISLHQNEPLPDGTHATDRPRSLIIHDARYSGIDSIQIEGRTHRDGQFARAYYAYAAGTVEEEVVLALLSKVLSSKTMSGDDVSAVKALVALFDKHSMGTPPAASATTTSTVPPRRPTPETPPAATAHGANPQAPHTHSAGGLSFKEAMAGKPLDGPASRRTSSPLTGEGLRTRTSRSADD